MSSSTTSDSLSKAYRLIEADELAAARAVLEPILASEPDNADAWWLYAHAVSDTFEARRALNEIIRINPNYPGAAELLSQVEVATRSESETEPLPAAPVGATIYDSEPELEAVPVVDEAEVVEDEPDFEPVLEERESRPTPVRVEEKRGRSWLPIAALVALVAIVLIAALLLNQGMDDPNNVVTVPSPSPEAGLGIVETEAVGDEQEDVAPTEETGEVLLPVETEAVDEQPMTEEPIIVDPVEEQPTVEEPADGEPTDGEPTEAVEPDTAAIGPVGDSTEADAEAESASATQVAMLPTEPDYTPLIDALSEMSVVTSDVSEMETELGETVVVTACSTADLSVRQSLPTVMDVIASRAAAVAPEADAVGARLVNCATEQAMIFIAVPKEQAIEYAVGNLTAEEFQATWRPQ